MNHSYTRLSTISCDGRGDTYQDLTQLQDAQLVYPCQKGGLQIVIKSERRDGRGHPASCQTGVYVEESRVGKMTSFKVQENTRSWSAKKTGRQNRLRQIHTFMG